MDREQEIRAAGIQAAAAFCAPISYVNDGQVPGIEDVLFVADVFASYIQGGWQTALQVHGEGRREEPLPLVQDVELRETGTEPTAGPGEPHRPPSPISLAPATPSEPEPSSELPTSIADIIPLEARGAPSKVQLGARRAIERGKAQRAERILAVARVAKTEEHRDRVLEDLKSSGLEGFEVEVNGVPQELGSYLPSLWRR